MLKPDSLVLLLEELETEVIESSVSCEKTSTATIRIGDKDADDLVLDAQECSLLFHSPTTVRQLFDALCEPANATIILHDVMPTDAVKEKLERTFTAVDEE